MDAEMLTLVLLEIRERTQGDDEAYDAAVDRLAAMLDEGGEGEG